MTTINLTTANLSNDVLSYLVAKLTGYDVVSLLSYTNQSGNRSRIPSHESKTIINLIGKLIDEKGVIFNKGTSKGDTKGRKWTASVLKANPDGTASYIDYTTINLPIKAAQMVLLLYTLS
jgi:hypothetical protein